jgi:hypothetical protein
MSSRNLSKSTEELKNEKEGEVGILEDLDRLFGNMFKYYRNITYSKRLSSKNCIFQPLEKIDISILQYSFLFCIMQPCNILYNSLRYQQKKNINLMICKEILI